MLLNLMGLSAPIILALGCIPPLIAGMGDTRFGMLTLVWVVLGYFSVFDLGIGRALTLAVAARRAQRAIETINPLVTTGLWLTLLLGVLGAAVLGLTSTALATRILAADQSLVGEVAGAFAIVAVAIPFVTMTAGLRGVLEAYDRFDITSAIRLAMGVITYAGPLVVIQFHNDLIAVVLFLATARVLTWAIHLWFVHKVTPRPPASPRRIVRNALRPLLVSGGWMTVSNVVSPALSYLDRFVVASIAGASVVAYYTTPYEAVSRLTVLPEAVLGVLFPALGAAFATDRARAQKLYAQSLRLVVAVMLPVVSFILLFAHGILSVWISVPFADQSYRVLQLLAVGVGVNCVARVPFTVIQSAARADLTAKLHLVELPLFLAALFLLTYRFGIEGAALAWSLRATLDLVAILAIQRRLMPTRLEFRSGWFAIAVLATTFAAALIEWLGSRSSVANSVAVLAIVAVLVIAWRLSLLPSDRSTVALATRRLFAGRT